MMDKLNFGDIVLLSFSFTDGQTSKRRPALILNDSGDGDIIVSRITSQIYNTKYDVYIDEWEKSGLKLPSIIRVHKIAALDKNLVDIIMGKLDESTKENVKLIFRNLIE